MRAKRCAWWWLSYLSALQREPNASGSGTTDIPRHPLNPSKVQQDSYVPSAGMSTAVGTKTSLTGTVEMAEMKSHNVSAVPFKVNVTRLPTEDNEDATRIHEEVSRTVLHIYFEQECGHKVITPTLSLPQERRFGPRPKEQKARRIAKRAARKLREASRPASSSVTAAGPITVSDIPVPTISAKDRYYLHTPYLSFHLPPSVLYMGQDRYAPSTPVALVHTGWFWRSYKIQLGPSLSLPDVIDPRGVVSWRHNWDMKSVLQDDKDNERGSLLKGYRVRGWRLWGESGKKYVHDIRNKRKARVVFDDPDVEKTPEEGAMREKVCADEVVNLTWTRPLSRHTRLYTFHFRGIEFQWKGTGTVSEGRKCGWMLRFCHLKLVAKIPIDSRYGDRNGAREVCLAKYTSSIAAEKSGTLEVFDQAVLRFVEDWMPGLLKDKVLDEKLDCYHNKLEVSKVLTLKASMLYQLFIATVICIANAEKEKRHTLIDLVIGILENASNGGG